MNKDCKADKHTNPHTGWIIEEHTIEDTVLTIKIKYFCKYCDRLITEITKYYIEYMI